MNLLLLGILIVIAALSVIQCWRYNVLDHKFLCLRVDMLQRWRSLNLLEAEDRCFGHRYSLEYRHDMVTSKLRHQLSEMAKELDIKETG